MTLRLRISIVAILGVAMIAGYFGWRHYERQLGAAKVEARDAKLAAEATQRILEQVQRDAQVNLETVAGLRAERDRLADSLADRPIPTIRVCNPSRSGGLPAASGASTGTSQGATAGRADPPVPAGDSGRDITAELSVIAEVAERLAAQDRALLVRERGFGDGR